jgi:hypothetical protein
MGRKRLSTKMTIVAGCKNIWMWDWIHCKVDMTIFLKGTYMSQTESIWGCNYSHKLVLFYHLNYTFQNVLDFISFFPWAKSDVVALCGNMGGHGFSPQSTYLVLHAFHRHSILSLIQVSTSENEIEQTSWCNINSLNILHILMIKNHFTF